MTVFVFQACKSVIIFHLSLAKLNLVDSFSTNYNPTQLEIYFRFFAAFSRDPKDITTKHKDTSRPRMFRSDSMMIADYAMQSRVEKWG